MARSESIFLRMYRIHCPRMKAAGKLTGLNPPALGACSMIFNLASTRSLLVQEISRCILDEEQSYIDTFDALNRCEKDARTLLRGLQLPLELRMLL